MSKHIGHVKVQYSSRIQTWTCTEIHKHFFFSDLKINMEFLINLENLLPCGVFIKWYSINFFINNNKHHNSSFFVTHYITCGRQRFWISLQINSNRLTWFWAIAWTALAWTSVSLAAVLPTFISSASMDLSEPAHSTMSNGSIIVKEGYRNGCTTPTKFVVGWGNVYICKSLCIMFGT